MSLKCPFNTLWIISEAVFTGNQLDYTDETNDEENYSIFSF